MSPRDEQMAERVLLLEELKQQSIEEVLEEVAGRGEAIIVRLPGGRQVVIAPGRPLRPLPALEGYIPEGWKDALYPAD